ncbi:MAG: type II secretion system protein [Planctomycetes bacterium]|nr:type II secretion system protein [Planctomycetota bacterium]
MNADARCRRGFTLVEVIVALGIAAGALVLLLSANHASLQRSICARATAKIQRLCESKLDELRSGAEVHPSGEFDDLPGWTWRADVEKAQLADLQGLKRLTLKVYSPDAPFKPAETYTILTYDEKAVKK